MKRLKAPEEESNRVKQMYAKLSFKHKVLKNVIKKRFEDGDATGTR